MNNKTPQEISKQVFHYVISKIKSGDIKPQVCAKCVCVDAHLVTPDEIGKKHIVWSHGKVEKITTLTEGMVLVKTLDENGKPVVDQSGHENIYDIKLEKFLKNYPIKINGHYMKAPYTKDSIMVAIKLPDNIIQDGLTLLPPNWGGQEGTLVKEGLLMFPFNPNKSLEEQIEDWELKGFDKLDWYPNNETQTYADCDKNGTFKSEALRKTFNQTKPYEGHPYFKNDSLEITLK